MVNFSHLLSQSSAHFTGRKIMSLVTISCFWLGVSAGTYLHSTAHNHMWQASRIGGYDTTLYMAMYYVMFHCSILNWPSWEVKGHASLTINV